MPGRVEDWTQETPDKLPGLRSKMSTPTTQNPSAPSVRRVMNRKKLEQTVGKLTPLADSRVGSTREIGIALHQAEDVGPILW